MKNMFPCLTVYGNAAINSTIIVLLIPVLFLGSIGCKSTEGWKLGTLAEPLPVVFKTSPTLEEIKTELNNRTEKIETLSSDNATLTAGNVAVPLRSCSVAVQRPRNIRVRGGTGLGTEVDFGSNNELFWFWAKRMPEKEIYYADHQQFSASPVRSAIPFDPDWLMESLGLITLKDTDRHEGPNRTADGQIQITSYLQTPSGMYTRIVTMNPQTAAINKHEIYDPTGRPLVATTLSKHAVDPSSGILLARKVEMYSTSSQEKLVLNLGDPKFNTPGGFSTLAFTMPSYEGYVPTDLCGPDFQRRLVQSGPQTQPTINQGGINQATYSNPVSVSNPVPANPGLGVRSSNPAQVPYTQGQYTNQVYHVPNQDGVPANAPYTPDLNVGTPVGTATATTYIRSAN